MPRPPGRSFVAEQWLRIRRWYLRTRDLESFSPPSVGLSHERRTGECWTGGRKSRYKGDLQPPRFAQVAFVRGNRHLRAGYDKRKKGGIKIVFSTDFGHPLSKESYPPPPSAPPPDSREALFFKRREISPAIKEWQEIFIINFAEVRDSCRIF